MFRFRIVSRMFGSQCESETRVPSSRGLVKQYNQELCISLITDVSLFTVTDNVLNIKTPVLRKCINFVE